MSETKPVSLADLDRPAGEVRLPPSTEHPKGRVVTVAPIDGIGTETLVAVREKRAGQMWIWEVAERCLPDATQEEVRRLSYVQAEAVVKIATGQLEQVEQLAGKGHAPRSPARAPSRSRTRSASS